VSQPPDGEQHRHETRVADGLAYVCQHLDTIRAALDPDQQQEPAPIQAVRAALRTGADLTMPLQTLHSALLDVGDALGVWHAARNGPPMVGIPDTPFEPIYLCPRDRCAGRRVDSATVFPLTCALAGQQLRRETL
jgi:uncharacterized protein YbjT (DUF2867 family)